VLMAAPLIPCPGSTSACRDVCRGCNCLTHYTGIVLSRKSRQIGKTKLSLLISLFHITLQLSFLYPGQVCLFQGKQ
jgi:hypothetical protein